MWIITTLLAVTFQTFRNAFSKKLNKTLGGEAVNLSRFLYGLPFVVIFYFLAKYFLGGITITSPKFFLFAFLFACLQALANYLFILMFGSKNFAVSVAFQRTDTIFTAILALFLLKESLSLTAWNGITISSLGLIFASLSKTQIKWRNILNYFFSKGVLYGIASGFCFGVAGICLKFGMNFAQAESTFIKSCFFLMTILIMQVIILVPISIFKNKKDLINILTKPKLPLLIGFFSAFSSSFWLFSFIITKLAYVKTLGQVEFIFSIFISTLVFKEKIYKNEYIGMALILIGCLMLIIF